MIRRRSIPVRRCDACRAFIAGPTRTHRPQCRPYTGSSR